MRTAFLPSESLLIGGPRGHWYFREGWRGPAPCLKAFLWTVIKGRFIWKELVSASGQARLGGPLRGQDSSGCVLRAVGPVGPAASVEQASWPGFLGLLS